MSKFVEFLENKLKSIPFIMNVCLIVIPIVLVFLIGWERPINLEKDKDFKMIETMIVSEDTNCVFEDIIINDVLYLEWIDSMNVLYPELRGNLFKETKTVFYNRIDSVDTVSCAIVFKTKKSFLKEKVDVPLYSVENVKRYFN